MAGSVAMPYLPSRKRGFRALPTYEDEPETHGLDIAYHGPPRAADGSVDLNSHPWLASMVEDHQQRRPEDARSDRDRLPFDDESPLQPSPTIPAVVDALPMPREIAMSVPLGRRTLAVGGANGWDSRL